MIIRNIYPPVVDSYMPAFIAGDVCRVYFSLSNYNTRKELCDYAEVVVYNQRNNKSALNSLSRSKLYLIHKTEDDKYYIEINNSDLTDGFLINQYYKVQIRLMSKSIEPPPGGWENPIKIEDWLVINSDFFSEWSTICLVKGIGTPIFDSPLQDNAAISNMTLQVAGSIRFKDEPEYGEHEVLDNYQLKIFTRSGDLFQDSGVLYSNAYHNINEINYTFNKMLEDGAAYRLEVKIVTKSLFSKVFTYNFTVQQETLSRLPAKLFTRIEEPLGSVEVTLSNKDTKAFFGSVMFRRTSSKSNFSYWEDIHEKRFNGEPLSYTWYDYTIESGVWYKYCVQKIDEHGNRGIVTLAEEPLMTVFEDMFLVADGEQLRIKFNPAIGSYKHNVVESKTDTIGAKYPFIRRNGAVDYRQLQISGLITVNMDYKNSFTSKKELFGEDNILALYQEYNTENFINQYNDFTWEREFRKKVIEFLHSPNVKLLRTSAEGNILVKLMDISFTPEAALGRMIYSFSATAYEIDSNSVENMVKYHINTKQLSLSEDTKPIHQVLIKNGQLTETIPANSEVMTVLKNKYTNMLTADFMTELQHLTSLKLEFNDPPYLIYESESGLSLTPSEADTNTLLGYLVTINQKPIIVLPDGRYNIKNGTLISSIVFPKETNITIDYSASIVKKENPIYTPAIAYYHDVVGQAWGLFKYTESIFKKLWRKYRYDFNDNFQKLVSINGVHIEAETGTICWIKDSSMPDFKRFEINDTNQLAFYEEDAVIEGLYFGGLHLIEATPAEQQRERVPINKFIETGISAATFEEIKNPILNGVYIIEDNSIKDQIIQSISENEVKAASDSAYNKLLLNKVESNQKRYIYYNNQQWLLMTEDNDILCPVEALVDYCCEITKGVYQQ